MNNILKIQILFFLTVTIISCQKIDSFMFENIATDNYLLDEYEGKSEIFLDSSYDILQENIHKIELVSNGYTIHGIYTGNINTIAQDTIIVYCHGNAGNIDYYWTRQKLLANLGSKNRFGVLMIDYKGYGMSEGTPSESGLVEDINAGLLWLKAEGLTNDRLIIYGFSLGSYPATYLSSKKNGALIPSKLILEAPFASTKVMVNDASQLSMKNNYYTSTDFEVADLIKDVNQPFLWMHGSKDNFLSIKTHGEIVYKNYGGIASNKIAIRVQGAGHSDLPYYYGLPIFLDSVLDFIEK
jgi:pimeloyl-ACP methyl ester carboxylesterase|tara:strand:+ start:4409 stop:5299 length:891 start_codon:yes stop_codon:yes gene_type:complete